MAWDDVRVRQWRFDRIYTWIRFGFRKEADFVAEPMPLRAGSSEEPMPLRAGSNNAPIPLRVGSFTTIDVQRGSFDVQFKRQDLDHAFVSSNSVG